MTTTPAAPAQSPVCFVDVETDGLHPGRRIWEIAIISRDFELVDGPVAERRLCEPNVPAPAVSTKETAYHAFVGIDLRNSDPFGLNVGGFWDRHPSGRKMSGKPPVPCEPPITKHDAARDIMRLTYGAHLVGVNPAFDAESMAGLLRSEGYLPSWHYHLVDMVAMSVGWLAAQPIRFATSTSDRPAEEFAAWPNVVWQLGAEGTVIERTPIAPPWKSDELSKACGVDTPTDDDRHSALADARWAGRWYDAITGDGQ